jgi:signal transduction histidine kinase
VAHDPDRYQPPLRWYSQAWRLALALSFSAAVWVEVAEGQAEVSHLWISADIALGVVAFVAVLLRRRWPVPVGVVTLALGALSATATGAATLALVSVSTRRKGWEIGPLAVLNLVSAQVFVAYQPVTNPSPWWVDLGVNAVAIVAATAWGLYLGSRRELLWTLRDRAERAETEQALRAANARGDERARIAREMHDALGHRISQISMHAGALSFREDLTADELRAGTAQIQARANEALTDLRGVLGVLRDDETGELVSAPQPTYADLPQLVAAARQSGQRVDLADEVDPHAVVPDPVGRTLYRIVQEALTNARKHAPAASVAVELSGDEEHGIDLVVRNPVGFARPVVAGALPPGGGLGLVGLVERAELAGGRLSACREGTTFVLRGWIPWTV